MAKFGLVILAASILAACTSAPTENFARNSQRFGLQLYKTLSEGAAGNIVISPVSIQTALALLYAGADGDTARELAQGLHFDADENVVAENHKSLLDHHAQSGVVKIANKIYLDKLFQVLPKFSQTASSKFYSEAETIDTSDGKRAAQIVNSWVARKTNNKIQDLVSADAVQDVASVIVNAVHFKADWINPFKNEATYPRAFWFSQTEKRDVDMMQQTDYFSFAEFDEFKVIKLDYKNTDISFVTILPNEREGLRNIESRFTEENANLNVLLSSLKQEKVVLKLPKFKVEFSALLKPTLTQMGMGTMFSNLADFSKLSSSSLKVESIIHKAIIEVDEKGTEAAAATAIMPAVHSLQIDMIPLKNFTADHPFLYFLVDANGQILFMGRYVK